MNLFIYVVFNDTFCNSVQENTDIKSNCILQIHYNLLVFNFLFCFLSLVFRKQLGLSPVKYYSQHKW
jgi:hypothetical protein